MGAKMTKKGLKNYPNSHPNYPNYYSVRVTPKSAANPRQPELGASTLFRRGASSGAMRAPVRMGNLFFIPVRVNGNGLRNDNYFLEQ